MKINSANEADDSQGFISHRGLSLHFGKVTLEGTDTSVWITFPGPSSRVVKDNNKIS